MYKDKNKYVFTLTHLICILGHQFAFSQDTASYKKMFLGHWVSYYGYGQDTIVYIPYNSPLAESISLELRYGGITFKDGDNYLHHRWKMCGNDDGPDFFPGKWSVDKLNSRDILTMIDIERTRNYIIIELAADKIVLVPTQ
jgi:hypothetical protein